MRKNTKLTELVTIAAVAVIAVVIIIGSRFLTSYDDANASSNGNAEAGEDAGAPAVDGEEIDIAGYENADAVIQSAYAVDGGYLVRVAPKGFIGPINMDITFNETGDTITSLVVNSHTETEGYGAAITEDAFLSQFDGISAPVYKEGDGPAPSDTDANDSEGTTKEPGTALADGTYTAETELEKGYASVVTVVVEGGAIKSVVWDARNEAGEYKSYLSSVGEYVMVEGNPTWKEQADALAAFVVDNQSLTDLTMNDEGKTDVVAGVSISINDFVTLVEECLETAASGEAGEGAEETVEEGTSSSAGTQIDGVSGATFTTDGVILGINEAYNLLKDFVIK